MFYNTFLEKGLCKEKSNTEYFLNEFLYIINVISIEVTLLKEFTLIEQVHQKSVIFPTIGIFFLNYCFEFQSNFCNRCHDLLMMSMNLADITILNIKDSDYHCIISLISKNEAINLMQNADLTKTSRTL